LNTHPRPLRLLMKEASNSEVLVMSRTVFAAVHGIVLLGVEQKMISVPPASLELSIEKFVRLSCAGLVHGSSSRKAQVVQGDLPRAPPA